MPVPLTPIKPYPCTYPDCFQSFTTEKEMKYHKLEEPTHFYCKKCNVDCEDWVALTEHKVDAMAPWLERKGRGRPEGAPKHIVCEFCGKDFKSMGGRELHRTRVCYFFFSGVFYAMKFLTLTDHFPRTTKPSNPSNAPAAAKSSCAPAT